MNLCRALQGDSPARGVRLPAGAFALGIVLFSASLREAAVCGALTLWTAFLASFLAGLFGNLPRWSANGSVLLLTGALAASAFRWADFFSGGEGGWQFAAAGGLIGLLAARESLAGEKGYAGALAVQSGLAWGLWLFCGAAREFLAAGSIFGRKAASLPIQSAAFGGAAFGFLAAGVVLGSVCGLARGFCRTGGYPVLLSVLLLAPPLFLLPEKGLLSAALGTGAALLLFFSVRRTLAFSCTAPSFRRLPVELLAFGLILLVLGAY